MPPTTVTVTAPPSRPSASGQPGPGTLMAPGSVSVTTLDPVAGSNSVDSGSQRVNTRPYSDTLYQYANCANERSVIYQLDRRDDNFEAIIGPSDDSQSGYTVFFTVTVDERNSKSSNLALKSEFFPGGVTFVSSACSESWLSARVGHGRVGGARWLRPGPSHPHRYPDRPPDTLSVLAASVLAAQPFAHRRSLAAPREWLIGRLSSDRSGHSTGAAVQVRFVSVIAGTEP